MSKWCFRTLIVDLIVSPYYIDGSSIKVQGSLDNNRLDLSIVSNICINCVQFVSLNTSTKYCEITNSSIMDDFMSGTYDGLYPLTCVALLFCCLFSGV